MGSIYVARSAKLARWASDVGLGRYVYKVGVTEEDPKALATQGWAGESDWTIVRKRAVMMSARKKLWLGLPARKR